MRVFLKRFLILLLVLFILIQFYPRAEKNSSSAISSADISAKYNVPAEVKNILAVACNDCHSNNTNYPWYSNIQPVRLWLDDHIEDGKTDLNFSSFLSYPPRKQYHKLDEIIELVEKDEMPLASYTIIHRDAKLSASQKKALTDWAQGIRTQMESSYPIDSLVRKKK